MLNIPASVARLCFGLACCLISLPASAVLIDFRDTLFSAADGQTSYSVNVSGIDLTLDTGAADAFITWNTTTGLGINKDQRAAEIGGNETLQVRFTGRVNLDGISVSNLFSQRLYDETGYFATSAGSQRFTAVNQRRGRSNGELSIAPGISDIDYVSFYADGRVGRFERHEFSLAALNVSVNPPTAVPLPPAAGLFIAGVLLMGWSGYRRRA